MRYIICLLMIIAFAGVSSAEEKTLSSDGALNSKLVSGKLGFRDLLVIKRHHISSSHVYTYHVDGFKPGGGLYVFSAAAGQMKELFNAGKGEIIDCDLSYDAKEVLFSMKRGGAQIDNVANSGREHSLDDPDGNYQLFSINIDGSGLKQLTNDKSNNLGGRWLPDGGIVFTSDRLPAFAYCWVSSSPVLHRMGRDGKNVQKISSSYLMDFTPAVLPDGRIIYTRWEYVDRPAIPIQGLWSIRPDGTSVAGYFGNRVLSPATFMQALPIPDTGKIICLLTTHNGDPRGAIGVVDPSIGGNAQAAISNLTPEVNIGLVDKGDGNSFGGPYETPYPIDQKHYFVSKAGNIQLREYDDPSTATVVLSKPDDGMGFYNPTPVMARKKPPVIARMTAPENQEPWADIMLADVYNGLEPVVKRGEVARICVVEEMAKTSFAPMQSRAFGFQFPLVSCGATYASKKVWGFADVAADGSAYFKAPANVPLYFLALDKEGRSVQRMRTFTHFMPGEKQSCAGCHVNRNYIAPISRLPVSGKQPQQLQPPSWGVEGFSYRKTVQPVLDKNCVKCHNPASAPNGVDLSGDMTDFFNVSYEILARKGTWGERKFMDGGVHPDHAGKNPYTSWIPTINGTEASILKVEPKSWGSPVSKLADIIISGHPDASGKQRVQLDQESRQRILTWIDLNVPYYPTSSSKQLNATGCRRIYPEKLDAVIGDISKRRCVSCHANGAPRDFYTRIEKPELNSFLLAPLAKSAGGTEKCGKVIFESKEDPDYLEILKTFEAVHKMLNENPRDDMQKCAVISNQIQQ